MRLPVLLATTLATLVLPAVAGAQQLAPYQTFARSGTTALGATDAQWSFAAGDYNRDGAADLWAIRRNGASGTTEIHILDAATNYQTFLAQTATGLHVTDANWDFAVADRNTDGILDLWAVNRSGASGKTEVHVLDGASGFQTFNTHAATALGPAAASSWSFGVADVDGDGAQDLLGVLRSGASNTTEVHVLNGASAFDRFFLQTPTALAPTPDPRWDFGVAANGDVYAVDRRDPASNRTSVHVLAARDGYKTFSTETPTALGPTDANWSFVPVELSFGPPAEILAVARGASTAAAVLDGGSAPLPAPDPGPGRCGTTEGQALTASLARRTVGFTAQPTVNGRLTRTDGTPVPGATVEVSTGFQSVWAPAATTTTGPDGGWTLKLPAGPTRPVYAAVNDGDATPVCSAVLTQRVRAGVRLKVNKRAVRNRQRVRLAGRLSGTAVAKRRIDVQGYEPRRKRWITTDTVRTTAKGTFRTSYRFTATTRRTTYRFRALVRTQTGLPYSRATSRTVKVRVRP